MTAKALQTVKILLSLFTETHFGVGDDVDEIQ